MATTDFGKFTPSTAATSRTNTTHYTFSSARTAFLLFLGVINIAWNSCTCLCVFKGVQLRLTARKITLVSHAVSGLLMVPVLVFQTFTGFNSVPACSAFATTFILLLYVCTLHMLFLSIDRHVAIFSPLYYRRFVPGCRFWMAFILMWFIPVIVEGIIPIFIVQEDQPFFSFCYFLKQDLSMPVQAYFLLIWFLLFIVPCALMVLIYINIRKLACYEAARVSPVLQVRPRRIIRELKRAKTIGMMTGGFLLSYVPIMIMYLYQVRRGLIPEQAEVMSLLAYTNAIIAPVIYNLRSRHFRSVMASLCTRQELDVTPGDFRMGGLSTINELDEVPENSEAVPTSMISDSENELSSNCLTTFANTETENTEVSTMS